MAVNAAATQVQGTAPEQCLFQSLLSELPQPVPRAGLPSHTGGHISRHSHGRTGILALVFCFPDLLGGFVMLCSDRALFLGSIKETPLIRGTLLLALLKKGP